MEPRDQVVKNWPGLPRFSGKRKKPVILNFPAFDPQWFVNETFTNVDGTELSAHNPSWQKITGHTTNMVIENNRAKFNNTTDVVVGYYNNTVPGSANYGISTDMTRISTAAAVCGPMLRVSSSVDTGYIALYTASAATWRLFRFVNGARAQINSTVSQAWSLGQRKAVEFSVIGTTLTLVVDGSTVFSYTDSNISAAGHIGIKRQVGGGAGNSIVFDNVVGVLKT